MVLDDDHRVPFVREPVQEQQQFFAVRLVQPDRRFFENVAVPARRSRGRFAHAFPP